MTILNIYDYSEKRMITKNYEEFEIDILNLSLKIKNLNITKGGRIGILIHSCYEFLIWDLAIQSLDLVPVIFPNTYSKIEASQLIEKYRLAFLVTSTKNQVSGYTIDHKLGNVLVKVSKDYKIEINDVHSLVFSSGSSGTLKGLLISKQGFNNQVELISSLYQVKSIDHMLNFLPMANNQQRLLISACIQKKCSLSFVNIDNAIFDCQKYSPTFLIAPPIFFDAILKIINNLSKNTKSILGDKLRFCISGMAPIDSKKLISLRSLGLNVFEAYGQAEIGTISANTEGNNKVGTVGKSVPKLNISISSEGEIIVNSKTPVSLGYFESSLCDQNNTFLDDCSIATGDLGVIDTDGYLSIIGRKKDALIMPNGEKIHPTYFENMFKKNLNTIYTAAYISKLGKICIAFIVEEYTTDMLLNYKSDIDRCNKNLNTSEKINDFKILIGKPTIENGLLTENSKYYRNGIVSLAKQSNSEIINVE